jgi:hypothetical protein
MLRVHRLDETPAKAHESLNVLCFFLMVRAVGTGEEQFPPRLLATHEMAHRSIRRFLNLISVEVLQGRIANRGESGRNPSWPGVLHSTKSRIHCRRPTCRSHFRLQLGVRVADDPPGAVAKCYTDSYCCNTQWAKIATGHCPGLLGPPPSQIPQPPRREHQGEAPSPPSAQSVQTKKKPPGDLAISP